jgi:hypothetical protein
MRIALFTPFSPEIGGGSALLRRHLAQLTHLDVEWCYLAKKAVPGNKRRWLGDTFTSAQLLSDLAARTSLLPGSKERAKQLALRMDADLYWVVAHQEGISMALQLCEMGKPVHLTVHDDPIGMWSRSKRFRIFRPLLAKTFPRALRAAKDVDVVSWAMRDLYREKYGVECFSVYLQLPTLPNLSVPRDPKALTIGHIGTLYRGEPFRRFMAACRMVAAVEKKSLRVVSIGQSPELCEIAGRESAIVENKGDLAEEQAIPLLARCDLLYAMYPDGKRYELFRRTSLPVKLSTYIQAQRPIFVHSPLDSSMVAILRQYQVARICPGNHEEEIATEIRAALQQESAPEEFERLRQSLMGFSQVQQLDAALSGNDWRT